MPATILSAMKKLMFPVLIALALTACSDSKEGPKAETSVSVDLDKAKEDTKDAFAKAGKEMEKGAEKTKEKLKEAGEAVSDKYEEVKDKVTDDKPSIKVEVKKE